MDLRHKLALVLLSAAAALIVRSAQARTPEDRCDELFSIYFRYVEDRTHHHDGEVARADFAKYQCETGRTAEGLRTLEAILTRNLIRYPTE
jgi:hypothetical protein